MSPVSLWRHRYAVLTAACTFLLLVAGGLVTSTDSGLAVPDWPLSYGTWFPPMVGGIRYEHGHRMIAGFVGLLILALAVWTGRREPRRWVRRLGFTALAAVVLQALLGGMTVLLMLPPQISISHALLGQTVFCLVAALAWATSPAWQEQPLLLDGTYPQKLRTACLWAAALAAMQLLLGAIIRHTGSAVHAHLAGAAALVWAGLAAGHWAWRLRSTAPQAWRFTARLLLLLGLQLSLGLYVYFHRGAALFRTAHVACGALVLAQAVLLAWHALRIVRASPSAGLRDFLELTKARLSALVLMSTAVGFWLGMSSIRQWPRMFWACAGTWLVVAGANALNQWMERDADARMDRTKQRPLPGGRMAPKTARRLGFLFSGAGLFLLAIAVNELSAWLALASWASYVLVYTPLKRVTPLSTLVGAIPGALPPVIGWTAATGRLDGAAWALFGIVFLWQLPHFLAIAILYRDDYTRGGFPMLPVLEPDGLITARQILLYCAALLPISLLPAVLGLSGRSYFFGALALSLGFLAVAVRAAWLRSPQSARHLFRASIVYLPLLLGLLAIDRIQL